MRLAHRLHIDARVTCLVHIVLRSDDDEQAQEMMVDRECVLWSSYTLDYRP